MSQTKVDIADGKVTFGKQGLKNLIRNAKDGPYMIELKEWQASKTNKQIRGFHGPMVKAMSEHTGYHKPRCKFILKDMFGEKMVEKNPFTGETKVENKSLAKYTKDEMTELISTSLMWMETELNIVIDMKEKKRYHLDELTAELEEF